jgi:hypothetical protein
MWKLTLANIPYFPTMFEPTAYDQEDFPGVHPEFPDLLAAPEKGNAVYGQMLVDCAKGSALRGGDACGDL